MANFVWTTINTGDLDKSIYFYQNLLGLELERTVPINEQMTLVFLKDQNGFEVELIHAKGGEVPVQSAPSNISIGFEVADLSDMAAKLAAAGFPIKRGPMEAVGIRFFFVEDPNGITVQLLQRG